MEELVRLGSPVLLESGFSVALFLLLPGLFAALGARLMQGSFARIVGGALGGGLRDLGVLLAVNLGLLTATNPHWEESVSFILVFFGACGGALGSCLAPYRGKQLWFHAALGGLLGQFLLSFVLLAGRVKSRKV